MTNSVTYEQLYDKLRRLGFEEGTVKWYGNTRRWFEHKDYDASLILLPDAEAKRKVEPMYIGLVRAILLRYDLIRESDFVLQ